jgi:hypothetical protein
LLRFVGALLDHLLGVFGEVLGVVVHGISVV